MKKMIRRVGVIGVGIILMLGGVFGLAGCGNSEPNRLTLEEHIQNITERAEQRFLGHDLGGGEIITSLSVYPINSIHGGFGRYFLVEFEPFGFFYVSMWYEESPPTCGTPPWWESAWFLLYMTTASYLTEWTRYENGVPTTSNRSHFYGLKSETKYLINVPQSWRFIPAVKRGNQFLNLISMQYFSVDSNLSNYQYVKLNFNSDFFSRPVEMN